MNRVFSLLALLTLLAGNAQARSDDSIPDEARRHFDAGSALFDVGDYPAAVRQLEAARALKPHPVFTYNIARCYERMERWTDAAQEYERYLPSLANRDEQLAMAQRIRALRERPAAKPPLEKAPEPKPIATTPPPPVAAAPSRSRQWVGALVVGVVAVGALAAGTGLYFDARHDYDQLLLACEQRPCGPADWSDASGRANAAIALWAVGGAVAAADVVWWALIARKRAPAPRAMIVPTLGGAMVSGELLMRAALLLMLSTAGCIDFESLAARYHPASDDAAQTVDAGARDLARGASDLAGAGEGCPELDLTSDPLHCGACDHDCTALPFVSGAVRCMGGACVLDGACLSGRENCDGDVENGCEADLTTAARCGGCSTACTGAASLCAPSGEGFACSSTCVAPLMSCGASCIDTSSDARNCGGCGNLCPTPQNGVAACVGGHCQAPTCTTGYHVCSTGCLKNTSTNSCGTSCTPCAPPANATATCNGTSCGFACNSGYTKSGSACIANLPQTWTQQGSGTVSGDFTAVWGSGPGDVYAVSYDIYHSTGNGSWSKQTSTLYDLTGVWGSGPGDVYVLGYYGEIGHSTGDGTWVKQHDDTDRPVAIWGSGANDIYVVGDYGLILHSTGDGMWTAQTSTTTATLHAVWGSGAGDVYATGDGGLILHSTGNGTWAKQTSNTVADLTALWGSGAGDVYAAGYNTTTGSNGKVLRSTGNGTWTAQGLPTGASGFRGMWGSGPGDVYTVGAFTILHSTGGGQFVKVSVTPPDRVTAIWGSAANNVYIVGNGGVILHGP